MSEQAPKTEEKPIKKYVPPVSEHIYKANLEAMGADEGAKGAAKFFFELNGISDHPIPIENEIKVHGLKNPSFLVIIGFSTRRVLESARSLGKTIVNTIIIEPSLAHFKQTISREYIGDLIKDKTIEFVVGVPKEELSYALFKIMAKSDTVLGANAARCATPEIITDPFAYPGESGKLTAEAQGYVDMVMETKNQLYTSMGCASDTMNRWENTIRNIENIQTKYEIKSLFGKFKGVPAIVLGAGPSMDEFIEAFHKYNLRDKALIIACDASLGKLLKNDIRPHLVTRCERKRTTIFEGIKKEDTKDIYYAAYPWTDPSYFDLFDHSFMMYRNNGVCHWSGFDPGAVNGGVSAANAGLELAYLLGCKSITLSGIDLAFIDGKSHTTGTEVEFDIEKSKPKWSKITANDGSEQTTIPVWKRCLKEYEHSFYRNAKSNIPVFNVSAKGARLNTTVFKTWEQLSKMEFPERLYPRKIIEANLTVPEKKLSDAYEEKKKKTIEQLASARHDLKKLFLFLDDAMCNSAHEETKALSSFRSIFNDQNFFTEIEGIKESLKKLYHEPCRQVDAFKGKYFPDKTFADTILDMVQHDVFLAENKAYSLKNLFSVEHLRQKAYVAIHMGLFREIDFYLERQIELLTIGPTEMVYDHVGAFGKYEKSFNELYGYEL